MVVVLVSSFLYSVFAITEQGTLTLEITSIGIRHGTPDNVNL